MCSLSWGEARGEEEIFGASTTDCTMGLNSYLIVNKDKLHSKIGSVEEGAGSLQKGVCEILTCSRL